MPPLGIWEATHESSIICTNVPRRCRLFPRALAPLPALPLRPLEGESIVYGTPLRRWERKHRLRNLLGVVQEVVQEEGGKQSSDFVQSRAQSCSEGIENATMTRHSRILWRLTRSATLVLRQVHSVDDAPRGSKRTTGKDDEC